MSDILTIAAALCVGYVLARVTAKLIFAYISHVVGKAINSVDWSTKPYSEVE